METQLKTMTVAQFAAEKGFNQIVPKVRMNQNSYPFITFINDKNEAENVYFSKAASAHVEGAMPVTKEMLAKHQIGITHNAEGEERVKLISNSERVELAGLL